MRDGRSFPALLLWLIASASTADAAEPPTREAVNGGLLKAVRFFHKEVASHGGYLWAYSGDLSLREGEGRAKRDQIWVQPPGTPTVGEALLDAHEATGEKACLDAALDAAKALTKGQLASGGWFYHIDFSPGAQRQSKTMLDDDTTQAATRFLMRVDKALGFRDRGIGEAARHALAGMIRAQRPGGGWYMWWKTWPQPVSEKEFPILKASYPASWPKQWQNKWRGRYYINDNLPCNVIRTMLEAWDTYREPKYLACAKKAGDWLVLAQMPEPQPAWAQQYDVKMQPVWDRKFEPPAITGSESQTVMDALLLLYRRTGEKKYLAPVPRAIAYFRKSLLPDGRLARFYELKTNKPLYFYRTGKQYHLTYDDSRAPSHYAFKIGSRLDRIEAEHKRLLALSATELAKQKGSHYRRPAGTPPAERVRKVLDALDERGAWVERKALRYHKVEPAGGVIDSGTFVRNVRLLCRFLGG